MKETEKWKGEGNETAAKKWSRRTKWGKETKWVKEMGRKEWKKNKTTSVKVKYEEQKEEAKANWKYIPLVAKLEEPTLQIEAQGRSYKRRGTKKRKRKKQKNEKEREMKQRKRNVEEQNGVKKRSGWKKWDERNGKRIKQRQ
jgi:hypothetical protein